MLWVEREIPEGLEGKSERRVHLFFGRRGGSKRVTEGNNDIERA